MLTQYIGFNIANLANLLDLFKHIPSNFNLVKSLFLSFSDLHVDNGVVISLSMSRVHELRGPADPFSISEIDCEWLIDIAGSIGTEETILSYLYVEFVSYQKSKKRKGTKILKTFRSYINHQLEKELLSYQDLVSAHYICCVILMFIIIVSLYF